MVKYIMDHEKHFPGLVKTTKIGRSKEGKALYSVEITSNAGKNGATKPSIGFIGALHGYDVIGQEILLMFIHHLSKKFNEKDQRIVQLLNSVRVHVVPNANVDGLSRAQKGDCNGTLYSGQDFYNDFGRRSDATDFEVNLCASFINVCFLNVISLKSV